MLLEVKNLSISFQTDHGVLEAIRDISFTLEEGETLGVVGESGCGKSITNLALLGLLPHNAIVKAEQLNFQGESLLDLSEKEWQKVRGAKISMIFQDPMSALNPSFSVGFQLDETLKIHLPELSKKQRYIHSLELLDLVGIPDPKERYNSFAHELSGGMSQRVMIATAIACRPKLLLADEPTTALDVTIQDQILYLLEDLQKKYNMGMILVTHDLAVVANHSKRLQVLYAGEVVESDLTSSIIHHPRHPYTHGLLSSLPGVSKTPFRQKLPSIAGIVPDLRNRPSGCQFHPRCEYKRENCEKETPELTKVDGRILRCPFPME